MYFRKKLQEITLIADVYQCTNVSLEIHMARENVKLPSKLILYIRVRVLHYATREMQSVIYDCQTIDQPCRFLYKLTVRSRV